MAVCIIPARGGSRRIPRKNIRMFHGKPIIAYSIAAAQASCLFERIIVSTDDTEIAAEASHWGAQYRPRAPDDCLDEVGTQEVVARVLAELPVPLDMPVCCLYPCAPFVHSYDLISAHATLRAKPARYVVSCYPNRLQDAGAFYWGRARDILARLPLIEPATAVFPLQHAIDINTEDDWQQAERLYEEVHGCSRS